MAHATLITLPHLPWLAVQDLDQLLPCIRFPLMLDGELEAVRWVLEGRELGAAVQAVAGGPLGRQFAALECKLAVHSCAD